jgi:molecular chaperone HscC
MQLTWREQAWTYEITAGAFEEAAAGLLARLREPVLRSLRDTGLKPEALAEVALVGGATRMPIVRRAVTRMFGRFPAVGMNPDEAIAIGAAIQAGLKARDAALKEVVLTDVCPYTLGVETSHRRPDGSLQAGLYAPIIERNVVVPASRVRSFGTIADHQRSIRFGVYQGEARLVADNIFLGELVVPVPPKRMGEVEVECRFTYDINGLLEVDVHVPATGERRQLVITDEDDGMDAQKLAQRRKDLEALKVHPRDTDANRAALARAARCYEHFLGERRAYVGGITAEFETALERQDPREAEIARGRLHEALDALEGERIL